MCSGQAKYPILKDSGLIVSTVDKSKVSYCKWQMANGSTNVSTLVQASTTVQAAEHERNSTWVALYLSGVGPSNGKAIRQHRTRCYVDHCGSE